MPEACGRQRPFHSRLKRISKPELHAVNLATWDDGSWSCQTFSETHPEDPDEPWPYRFKNGNRVWVCASDGKWYHGKIVGQAKKGKTRFDDGLWWCVEFYIAQCKIRKWFAPLNGDIKPDSEHTTRLLSDAGCLPSDGEE